MPIVFHIPGPLRSHTGGQARVELQAAVTNVSDALDVLGALYPGVRDRVLLEEGRVRPHVNIFVGQENIRYTGGLATPVWDGNEITILPAVSGGIE